MWFVLSLIFLLLTVTLILSFPSVQTAVAQYAVSWVNDKYDTHIELEKMRYVFPDEIVLKEVYVPDEKGDTMVYASAIDLHFHGFNSLTNTAYSTGATVDDLKLYWVMQPGETEYNFQKFINRFSSGDTSSAKPFNLEIAGIEVNNGIYRYEDLNCDSCFAFYLKDLNLEVNNFELEGQYVSMDVKSLRANDEYSLNIESFSTYFEYQTDHISFEDLEFTTAKSVFEGQLSLNYGEMPDFRDFVNKVVMVGEIEKSSLSSREIQHFGPEFPDFGQFSISGSVEGIVNDMQIRDVELDLAGNTHLEGDLALRNTTDPENLYLKASHINLRSNPDDAQFVHSLFSDTLLPKEVKPLGNIHLQGNFDGYLDNFKTQASLTTDLGEVNADLFLQSFDDEQQTQYKGKVELLQFDLGKLVDEPDLGLVSTNLVIDGKGLDPPTMDTRLKGQVSLLQYNDYAYQNITVDGEVRKGNFNGQLNIRDPNLKFGFDGTASFRKDTSTYNFIADVEMADLHALNFVKDSVAVVTAEMSIDMVALNYNKWAGDILIYNSTFENKQNFHFFQDISIHSEGLDTNRYMEVRSNIFDANLRGNYTLEGIVDVVGSQISKFVKTLNPVSPPKDQEFHFDIDIKNTQILTDIFFEELDVEPNSKLVGNYSSDSNTFNIDLVSPGFMYNKNEVDNMDLSFHGSPDRSQLSFNVDQLKLKSGFEIDSINLGNFYYNDTLFYDLRWILRDSIDSRTNLLGYAIQEDTSTYRFGIFESDFNIGFQKFTIPGGNSILLDTGGLHIEDLRVVNEQRAIYINGNISDNPNEILRLKLEGFGMELANYFIGSPSARFNGELYGDILLTELLGQPKFAANVKIDSLDMNSTYLGNFSLSSDWAVRDDTINIEASLRTGTVTTFAGKGYYQPDSLGGIAFDLNFDRFRLAAFDPFLTGIAQDLRGYVDGSVTVKGNTGTPLINGDLSLPQTAFTISLLNTDYNFVGTPQVKITPDAISFPDLKVRDTKYGTEGAVSGKITHQNFSNFNLDLEIDANELLVLNTTIETEDPYYGTAFVSGDIAIKGPIDEILITADVVSARNTKFYLPIDGATEVGQTGFVTFVDHSQKDDEEEGAEPEETEINLNKGVTIDFNIEIDQNADVAIIIDSEVGNQLEAKGTGNIRLIMKPYSDLMMYGTYTVIEGYYNFVLPVLSQSLLNRRFDVMRGGSVTWNGDPLGALISLTARYTTKADPSALIAGNNLGTGPTLTVLDLYLSGELMDPEIRFDISAPRAPTTVQSALSNQIANQDALYTQVFAILALNRFAPNQGLDPNTAGRSLGLSALTGQAANYINMLTGEYQVSLDYQIPDNETSLVQPEVEVGVSKRFFNNRFNVTTELGVPVDRTENQNQNQDPFTGDIELEYSITEDGRFRAKAFNRSVQREYTLGQQNYQQGVGVFYRMDFDKWSEFWDRIWGGKQDKAIRQEDEENEDLLQEQKPKASSDSDAPDKASGKNTGQKSTKG